MKKYLKSDPWKIIEEGFRPEFQKSSESIFSIGNGHMGQRANFEEAYSGPSLQGHYMAGIYYPDKTRVGWWKNGYPEYFAKVLNAPSWIGININVNGQVLDLNKLNVSKFTRILDMKEGVLYRSFEAEFTEGEVIRVNAERFLSMARRELGCIKYSLELLKGNAECHVEFCLDGDIQNEDSNYNEKFWEPVSSNFYDSTGLLSCKTRKTGFIVSTAMETGISLNGNDAEAAGSIELDSKKICKKYSLNLKEGDKAEFRKFACIATSRDHQEHNLDRIAVEGCREAAKTGYEDLKNEHLGEWQKKWELSDIIIEGDVSAQQGIRFSIFQLNQTYTGHDPRLNIGPKGFTGEKYGGSTYWDTEAFCLPFYLKTTDPGIAKNLLIYRYKHLPKAIENAAKLGFRDGAALYPMVTMNGEECHNEWEITFEEIHRNGAIAFAIYNYIRHTGDEGYMADYGLEVLAGISRFWVQRAGFSEVKNQYVILGVTGPNEYENNVNNNWYTNYIAAWTLKYAAKNMEILEKENPERYQELCTRLGLDMPSESDQWLEVADNLYMPVDKGQGIILQQEGYLDKEQLTADQIPDNEKPINQYWSWDRILRSCFIKQADVLQGLYFFEDDFDQATHKRNFEFYEPRTVHESSLSPSIHSILACKLGMKEKAYELYQRTARLDLDDYNHEVHEGCHITSMAGSWLAVVEGFGGMRIKGDTLHFNPLLPDLWDSLEFRVRFRGRLISVNINREQSSLKLLAGNKLKVYLDGEEVFLD